MADKDEAKDRLAQIARENKEQIERSEGVQPTPTQEENDRARLGVRDLKQLDDKEPDGSAEQDLAPRAPAPVSPNAGANAKQK